MSSRLPLRNPTASIRHLLAGCFVAVFLAGAGHADDYEAGVVQVELVPGGSIASFSQRYGTSCIDSLPPLYQVSLPDGDSEAGFIQILLGDPEVVSAEFSWESETPEGVRQMVVTAVGGTIEDYLDQGVASRLRLAEAHALGDGTGVLVAVIDTGVLASHPALQGAIAAGGWDFVDGDSDPADSADGIDNDGDGLTDEGAGHGTMVAGIIHLVAPGASILPIRVLDDEGQSTTFSVAKAIRYAFDRGADVVNLSLGLTTHSSIIGNEIEPAESASILLASAAGNLGVQNPQYYPASDSHVLSVAAVDTLDIKTDFSNWHSSVAVSAPGQGILAPFHDGGYAVGAGTSFATPFVSGICALARGVAPGLDQEHLYEIIRAGTVPIDHLEGNLPYEGKLGTGRVDAYLALARALQYASAEGLPVEGTQRLLISPNPARAGEPIRLLLEQSGTAGGEAIVYDPRGREAARIPLGADAALWQGRSATGEALPAGVYFLRTGLEGSGAPLAGRLVLLKP